jgi:hypothetical protein
MAQIQLGFTPEGSGPVVSERNRPLKEVEVSRRDQREETFQEANLCFSHVFQIIKVYKGFIAIYPMQTRSFTRPRLTKCVGLRDTVVCLLD